MSLVSAMPAVAKAEVIDEAVSFDSVYASTFEFAWRLLRRLGVPPSQLDDAAQEVFVTVHRKLRGFQGRSSVKTWVAGICARVASDVRRSLRRRGEPVQLSESLEDPRRDPHEAASSAQALRMVQQVLETFEEGQREVFVLTEMEQMSAPEISEALGVNLNTIYSRLRLARKAFDAAVATLALEERS
jgi:RNA polymerase sigma-70 factor (ECF subfamily)